MANIGSPKSRKEMRDRLRQGEVFELKESGILSEIYYDPDQGYRVRYINREMEDQELLSYADLYGIMVPKTARKPLL